MKKIIDGKAYNTETARLLTTVQLPGQKRDDRGAIQFDPTSKLIGGTTSLYETPGGAYFIVREVKEGLYANDDFRGGDKWTRYISHPGLYALTRKQALVWAESKRFDIDKIESMFGNIEEAGETTGTMLLRLPKGLKASIEQAAASANQSANTWVMRCVERCASEAAGR
jgi:hypothetical protein